MSNSEHNNEQHHEPQYREPVMVFIGLIMLTIMTVGFSGITHHALAAVLIALGIACVKGFLVLWYFMHVKYEKPIFKVFISVAFGTFIVIIALLFSYYMTRSL